MRGIALALVALMAGCAAGPGTDNPTTTSTSPGQPATVTNSANGVDVAVTWRTCEQGYCAHAVATNTGTTTYKVSTICEEPWHDRMTRGDREVAHREPMAVCAAYGRADFAPHDTSAADVVWDGQLYDEARQELAPAPAGQYTWTLVFWYEAQEGGPRLETTADIHLTVGAA